MFYCSSPLRASLAFLRYCNVSVLALIHVLCYQMLDWSQWNCDIFSYLFHNFFIVCTLYLISCTSHSGAHLFLCQFFLQCLSLCCTTYVYIFLVYWKGILYFIIITVVCFITILCIGNIMAFPQSSGDFSSSNILLHRLWNTFTVSFPKLTLA